MHPLIDIHSHRQTHATEWLHIFNVVLGRDKIPETLYTCGIHPWHIDPSHDVQISGLEAIASGKNCIAIGECGIDKLKGAGLSVQIEIFEKQITLAQKLSKPLIIHCVRAFEEVYLALKKHNYSGYFILHGFNSKPENVAKLIALESCHFSFGAALLKKDSNAEKLFSKLPLDKCFFETDDKEVEIKNIYLRAAEIKGISIEVLITQIQKNYNKLFH